MKRLMLFLIFCASLASAQLAIRNPGFLGSLQPSTAASTWSSNGMTLWLKADDLTGVSDNAAPILWTNRISGRLSFTNTASTAVIKSNSVFNGHAALYFTGGGTSHLKAEQTTNWNAFVNANEATFIFVIRQWSVKAQNGLFSWTDAGIPDVASLYATFADVFYFDFPNTGGGRISGAQPAGWDDKVHILEVLRASGEGIVAVDGTNVVAGAPTGSLTSTANDKIWYLGSADSVGDPFQGDIAEVRWWTNRITNAERDLNGADLSSTYGTPTYSRP